MLIAKCKELAHDISKHNNVTKSIIIHTIITDFLFVCFLSL